MAGAPRLETVNVELLTLTYGAIVTQVRAAPPARLAPAPAAPPPPRARTSPPPSQLLRDYEDPKEVNAALELMGYNIGVRVVDEFCAKSRAVRCRSFRETMDTVGKEAFRIFLGVPAYAEAWAPDGSSCSLRIPDNPLADGVEVPAHLAGDLRFSNSLVGVLRGALEMVSLKVACTFTKDALAGDDTTEMRVTLLEVTGEGAGKAYEDE